MAKYSFAIIGGSYDSFMGPVHRMAASLDGLAELRAGAFSRNEEKNKETGRRWNLDPARVYGSYEDLLKAEQGKLDVVVIATPNHLHVPIIARATELGYAVVSDKPLGTDFASAYATYQQHAMRKKYFMLTHNYSGFSMVKEARERVRGGDIGTIHRVAVRYEQGWLQAVLQEAKTTPKLWRMDVNQVGESMASNDIGSHTAHIIQYVTGLRIQEVMAQARCGVPGVSLDTDVDILLRFDTGALGYCTVSYCSTGLRNPFEISVFGSNGSISWNQEYADRLRHTTLYGSDRYTYHGSKDAPTSLQWARIPMGHSEGYIGAFANLYKEFFRALLDNALATADSLAGYDIPSYEDGLDGLAFTEAVRGSFTSQSWTPVSYPHQT